MRVSFVVYTGWLRMASGLLQFRTRARVGQDFPLHYNLSMIVARSLTADVTCWIDDDACIDYGANKAMTDKVAGRRYHEACVIVTVSHLS